MAEPTPTKPNNGCIGVALMLAVIIGTLVLVAVVMSKATENFL